MKNNRVYKPCLPTLVGILPNMNWTNYHIHADIQLQLHYSAMNKISISSHFNSMYHTVFRSYVFYCQQNLNRQKLQIRLLTLFLHSLAYMSFMHLHTWRPINTLQSICNATLLHIGIEIGTLGQNISNIWAYSQK